MCAVESTSTMHGILTRITQDGWPVWIADGKGTSAFGQDSAQQSLHGRWRLASQLGPPWSEIVPPVVIREVNGQVGSFALERPGKAAMSSDPWSTGEWREAAFFDCLIGQQDRHPGNFLVAGTGSP
jgi:hypothetical protein